MYPLAVGNSPFWVEAGRGSLGVHQGQSLYHLTPPRQGQVRDGSPCRQLQNFETHTAIQLEIFIQEGKHRKALVIHSWSCLTEMAHNALQQRGTHFKFQMAVWIGKSPQRKRMDCCTSNYLFSPWTVLLQVTWKNLIPTLQTYLIDFVQRGKGKIEEHKECVVWQAG